MRLIIGSPNSGKSALGEDMIMELCQGQKKAYIATMIPFGEEGEKRVKKHRRMREGKGFITYERGHNLETLVEEFEKKEIKHGLLECLSNLAANEMFLEENHGLELETIADKIVKEVCSLDASLENFVVITNEFEASREYDFETNQYIKLVSLMNERLKPICEQYMIKIENEWITYENN